MGEATIVHHGYDAKVVKNRQKVERNLRLLQQAVLELPDEPNLEMNLGLEMVRFGQLDQGILHYLRAFELMAQEEDKCVVPELREALLTQLTTNLMKQKNYSEVVRVLEAPLAQRPGLTASLHYTLGFAYFQLKRFAESAAQMRQCIAQRNTPALSPIIKEIKSVAPQHVLATCLGVLQQNEEAEAVFKEAIAQDPHARTLLSG